MSPPVPTKGLGDTMYVPRHYRPERKEALAALVRFLERYPDLRIGQACFALTAGDPFNLEDEDIIKAVREKTQA